MTMRFPTILNKNNVPMSGRRAKQRETAYKQ